MASVSSTINGSIVPVSSSTVRKRDSTSVSFSSSYCSGILPVSCPLKQAAGEDWRCDAAEAGTHSGVAMVSTGRGLTAKPAPQSARGDLRCDAVQSHLRRSHLRRSSNMSPIKQLLLVMAIILFLSTQPAFPVGAAAVNCPQQFSPWGSSCYALFQTKKNFLEAHVHCRTFNNGYLATITSQEELNFVRTLLLNRTSPDYDVWIGLTDKETEGTFQWVSEGVTPPPAEFPPEFWAAEQPLHHLSDQDCVALNRNGFHVSAYSCSEGTGLDYVCEQDQCLTAACAEAVTGTDDSNTGGIVAAIVICVLLIILIVLALLYTWKFHNDKWELYVCYLCKMRESKTQVRSLQQENQRLRRQLSQQRSIRQVSLTVGIASPGGGAGGVLSTLQPMAQTDTNSTSSDGSTDASDGARGIVPTTLPPLAQMDTNSTCSGNVSQTQPNPRSVPPVRQQTTESQVVGGSVVCNVSAVSRKGQPSNPTLSMSRHRSPLKNRNQKRVMPSDVTQVMPSDSTQVDMDSVGVKSPTSNMPGGAFVAVPNINRTAFVDPPPPPPRVSVSDAFSSTAQEDPEAEMPPAFASDAGDECPGGGDPLPGELDES